LISEILPRFILVISTIFDKMKVKRFLYFTLLFIIFSGSTIGYSQVGNDSSKRVQVDTLKPLKQKNNSTISDTVRKKARTDTSRIIRKQKATVATDSLTKTNSEISIAGNDSASVAPVPFINSPNDTALMISKISIINYRRISDDLLSRNKFINVKDEPLFLIEDARDFNGKEFLFYTLCVIVLILGLFRTFYSQYFNNLFRVFFNTSLRQTQLTDQLMQAKLPSFILNIFFVLAAGIYVWLLFMHFHPPRLISKRLLLPFCIVGVAILYFLKFCILKFMGWISDIRPVTDNYIFVIFLINKITGILLVPFIIVLAFSMPQWINTVATVSLLVLGLFFLSRYVKSYGVIEKKMPLNPFHFIIYIVGAEILPLAVIYKVAVDYLV
jgi:hypothetical protein